MKSFQYLPRVVQTLIHGAFEKLDLWLIKKSCLGYIDGVAISDNTITRRSPETFLAATRDAMALIKEVDPRRYRRVCRQLAYIVNKETVAVGSYSKKFKICTVDFSKFSKLPAPRSVRRYASLLIHESTHGVVAGRGIRYDKDKRLRVERLSHLEEYRFAKHFESGFAEAAIGAFNPEKWRLAWGPKKERTSAEWKRFREAWRGRKR